MPASDRPSTADTETQCLVIAGTYERLLYGLKCNRTTSGNSDAVDLKEAFIFPSHLSCIKCLAVGGRFLATGSSDEHVKLYDLKLGKEVGTLMHHAGSITSLAFFQKTHLLTASEDGNIAIVRTKDWEVLKTLKGHIGAVHGLSVHPSGKVALSVGKDRTLRCWNLMKANCAYSIKLDAVGDQVTWNPSGTRYAVLSNSKVTIYSLEDGSTVGSIESRQRINCMSYIQFIQEENEVTALALGCEDGTLGMWHEDGSCLVQWKSGHARRVKAIAVRDRSNGSEPLIASGSSDGNIRLWAPGRMLSDAHSPAIGEYHSKCRLTCLLMAPLLHSFDE